MPKMLKMAANPLFVRAIKRLFVASALAVTLVATVIVHSQDRFTCHVQDSGGYSFWLSCGSSAGNFWYRCDGQGNCDDCDTEPCQETADQWCESGGCP